MIANGETTSKQTDSKPGRTAWVRGVLAFIAMALLALLSFRADMQVENWIREHRADLHKDLAGYISDFGDWPWLMAAGAAAGGIFWWRGNRKMTRIILLMMVASTLAGATANTLRLTTGRTRPNIKHVEQGFYGLRHDGKWLFGRYKFNSFPSGHTATAFGFLAVPFFLHYRKTGSLLLIGGAVMALARMTIDAHHFSDVCFGAWFGLLGAWTVVRLDPARKLLPSPDTHEIAHPRGL